MFVRKSNQIAIKAFIIIIIIIIQQHLAEKSKISFKMCNPFSKQMGYYYFNIWLICTAFYFGWARTHLCLIRCQFIWCKFCASNVKQAVKLIMTKRRENFYVKEHFCFVIGRRHYSTHRSILKIDAAYLL